MNDASTYFGFGLLFVLATIPTAVLAVRSGSPFRWIAPVAVIGAFAVIYFGLDRFVGTAKPVIAALGWHGPAFGQKGVIVLGGRIESQSSASLLLQEEDLSLRLWAFSDQPEMVKNLKQAIKRHAEKNEGRQWGFAMQADGERSKDAAGVAILDGKPGAVGAASLETRVSKWKFAEPAGEVMPSKDGGATSVSVQ